jgi:uncharacterized protein
MSELVEKLNRLRSLLEPMKSAIVAFSGGVDSSFLLKVTHQVLGDNVLALTTTSPTMPREDLESARALVALIGARHMLVESNELVIPGYAANPTNRCYLCKSNLYTICEERARQLGVEHILDGLNLDDLGDYRPGIRAAEQRRVRHPLVEAGLRKAEIRELSRSLALPTWDRPASPCLSSRFPYGTKITAEALAKVEEGERLLRCLGFKVARVRYHDDVARLELERDEMGRIIEPELADLVFREFRRIGFRFVALDLKGFRSGSLNEGLASPLAS